MEIGTARDSPVCVDWEKAALWKFNSESEALLGYNTHRIGSVFADQGKYQDAIQTYMDSLAIKTSCFGNTFVSVASTYLGIANVFI